MKGGMSIMRIGVIDSDAIFQHPFFYGKKIEIKRMNPGYVIKNKNFPIFIMRNMYVHVFCWKILRLRYYFII